MSRIRSIHPPILTDEAFMALTVECPLAVALLIGLWIESDDAGVFEWKPLTLKARILPAVSNDISPLMDALVKHAFIRSFEVAGKPHGVVRNFAKFQRPKKPKDIHPATDEMRTYAGFKNGKRPHSETGRPSSVHGSEFDGDEPSLSSEPVPNQFGSGSEIHRQKKEEGGRRKRNDEASSPAVVAPSSVREGTTAPTREEIHSLAQLEAECRALVGGHPVATNVNFGPIVVLVGQGASHSDVIGGVRAALSKPDFQPRSWSAFENFIRRERTLAQARDLAPHQRSSGGDGMSPRMRALAKFHAEGVGLRSSQSFNREQQPIAALKARISVRVRRRRGLGRRRLRRRGFPRRRGVEKYRKKSDFGLMRARVRPLAKLFS
jgi:hypothetical protein